MKWSDVIAQAFNNLMRRKLRSALTMLGVVIGTAAIVVTISLGYGAEQTQMAALEGFTNLRQIQVYPHWGTGSDPSQRRITKINDSVLSQIRRIPNVDAVSPIVHFYIPAQFVLETGKLENMVSVMGVLPRDFAKMKKLKSGNYFSSLTDRMEFIMSEILLMEYRNPDKDYEYIDPYTPLQEGKPLPLPKVNWLQTQHKLFMRWEDYSDTSSDYESEPETLEREYKARMIGILPTTMQELNDWNSSSFQYYAIVNINWLKRFVRDNRALLKDLGYSTSQQDELSNYQNLLLQTTDVDSVSQVTNDLRELGVQCSSMLDTVAQFKSQIQTMQAFLGFIGMISMMVAALSIANTMMMSIYERTREIGVMKVLGCKLNNIRMMFLSEAAFIGVFGGLFGLVVSFILSYALNNVPALQSVVQSVMQGGEASYFMTMSDGSGATTSIIPAFLALGTWAGVVLVSVISGIQPAQRAMKLSSLAAIRSAE